MKVPAHIAIIMDGNGRWAKARGMARNMGHQEGVNAVRAITTHAARIGVKYLTLYTFSTENWKRPADEVAALMTLLLHSLEEELFMKNDVRLRIIGDVARLPREVAEALQDLCQRTEHHKRMTMVLALSYSARWEITEAVKQITTKVKEGIVDFDQIDEETISNHLTTAFMPDPDLLIRTGGEVRLSNYLLWQVAYTECYFTPTLWPDFREKDLDKAIEWFNNRERRYGLTSEQIQQPCAQ